MNNLEINNSLPYVEIVDDVDFENGQFTKKQSKDDVTSMKLSAVNSINQSLRSRK